MVIDGNFVGPVALQGQALPADRDLDVPVAWLKQVFHCEASGKISHFSLAKVVSDPEIDYRHIAPDGEVCTVLLLLQIVTLLFAH